jgi:hypothetical protein
MEDGGWRVLRRRHAERSEASREPETLCCAQGDLPRVFPSSILYPPSSLLLTMPDQRRHRGAHPEDARLFAPERHSELRSAVGDLSWLLTREYASVSALKVVGDRYDLTARQRLAVMRCACSDQQVAERRSREIGLGDVAGQPLLIDGYNLLTTIEAALAGGLVIVGRDGCWRDMASMHGTWRRVEETVPAIERVGGYLEGHGVAGEVTWLLDSPVSNSGRLKGAIEEIVGLRGWRWRVELVPDPDKVLVGAQDSIAVTADSAVLDRCGRWVNLAREIVREMEGIWIVDLSA